MAEGVRKEGPVHIEFPNNLSQSEVVGFGKCRLGNEDSWPVIDTNGLKKGIGAD